MDLKSRRQLEQNGAEAIFQMLCSREKEIDRRARVPETLDVCQEPACFKCKNELRWNLSAPALEHCFTRQSVKAVINLHRVEVLSKKLQPLRRPKVFGIKFVVPPVFVVPTTCADISLCHRLRIREQLAWQVHSSYEPHKR